MGNLELDQFLLEAEEVVKDAAVVLGFSQRVQLLFEAFEGRVAHMG